MVITAINTFAGLTNLERETLSTFATEATVEREAMQTFAGLAFLRHEAFGVFAGFADLGAPAFVLITFAAFADLEAPADAVRTFASLANLEAPAEAIITFAVISTLEAPEYSRRTFACLTDLIYYKAPLTTSIVKKFDLRNQSRAHPIVRLKATQILLAGETEVSSRLNINCKVKQITFKVPELGGANARIILLDEMGAEIYNSGAQAQDGIKVLFDTEPNISLVGNTTTLKVVISSAQGSNVTFVSLIYGT